MARERKQTGREAFNRLFWDARINRDLFVLGVADRVVPGGIREVPLVQWDATSVVPWHRLRYIRCGEVIVWDRENDVDRLSSEDLPARAWLGTPTDSSSVANAGRCRARALYRYLHKQAGEGTWEPTSARLASPEVHSFTLATWNVLNDFGDPEIPSLDLRLPLLRAELTQNTADIIALQEVTPGLLPQLLETPLSSSTPPTLFLSESPNLTSIDPHGPVLLSRFPFSVMECAGGARPVVIGTWTFKDRLVHVANVHLPSNRSPEAGTQRRHILEGLFEELQVLMGDILVVGDFNIVGDELADLIIPAGYQDVWTLLCPGEEGTTFDPPNNPLARQTSRTGMPVRFDRILWRPAEHWMSDSRGSITPVQVELFATTPYPASFASDHYGLHSEWHLNRSKDSLANLAPVHRSALTLIPPEEAWPAIQTLRERHDKHIDRWMPHINLLYGFIPQQHFEEAAELVAHALEDLEPFDVVLEGYGTFTHRRSCTAWLRPITDPPDALHTLQARLEQLFPRCTEQSQHSPEGFTPHLSVGQFDNPRQAMQRLPAWEPLRWRVESVALIAREGNDPFRVHYRVPLGGGGIQSEASSQTAVGDLEPWVEHLHPLMNNEQRDCCQQALADLETLVSGVTGQPAGETVIPVGSWRLGVAGPDSDVDVVCLHPPHLSRRDFFHQLRDALADRADILRLVEHTRMPMLSFRLHGQVVDVLAARTPMQQIPAHPTLADFSDPESWQAARACAEADLLLEVAERAMPVETFHILLRAVRAWARLRQIQGNAWGFVGGFPWALLTAWSAHQSWGDEGPPPSSESPGVFLAHFFRVLANHPWPQPIALTPESAVYRPGGPRDRMPIVRPLEPYENTAYNITRSTLRILRGEWRRAARLFDQEISGERVLAQLFTPIDLLEEAERFLVFTLTGPPDEVADLAGQAEGRMVGLLVHLERQAHLHVRPWPRVFQEGTTARLVLGLPALRSRTQSRVQQLAQEFVDGVQENERVKRRVDIGTREARIPGVGSPASPARTSPAQPGL